MKSEKVLQIYCQSFNHIVLYQWFHKNHFKKISKSAKMAFLNFCNSLSIDKSRSIKLKKQDQFIMEAKQRILRTREQSEIKIPYNDILILLNLLQGRYNYLCFLDQFFNKVQQTKSQKDTLAIAIKQLTQFNKIVQNLKQILQGNSKGSNSQASVLNRSNSGNYGFSIDKKIFTISNKKKMPKYKIAYRNSLPYNFNGNKNNIMNSVNNSQILINQKIDDKLKSRMKTQATQNNKHNEVFVKSRPVASVQRKIFSFTISQQNDQSLTQTMQRSPKRIKTAIVKKHDTRKLIRNFTEFGVDQFFPQSLVKGNAKNNKVSQKKVKLVHYETQANQQTQNTQGVHFQFMKLQTAEQTKSKEKINFDSDSGSQKQEEFKINYKKTRKFSRRHSSSRFTMLTDNQIKQPHQQQGEQRQKQRRFIREGIKNVRKKGILHMRQSYRKNLDQVKTSKLIKKESLLVSKQQKTPQSSALNSPRKSLVRDKLDSREYSKYKISKRRFGEFDEISEMALADHVLCDKNETQKKTIEQRNPKQITYKSQVTLLEAFSLHSKFKQVKCNNFSFDKQTAFFIPQLPINQKQEQLKNVIQDVTQIYKTSNKSKFFNCKQSTNKQDKLFSLANKVRQHFNSLEQFGEKGRSYRNLQLNIENID